MSNSLALYFHWPFCESKCPYCDFNSHVRDNLKAEEFEKAYFTEIKHYDELLKSNEIDSIFFGGGTPSLMRPEFVEKLLNHLSKNYNVDLEKTEITLEANPSSTEASKFQNFKSAGINRTSIGIQSFDDEALKFLGRKHSSKEAKGAIEIAAKTFDNFSFDLIYSIPNQTTEKWQKQLKQALEFNPNHISCYQLTIEKGTEFFKDYREEKFHLPEDDLMSDLYELTNNFLSAQGLKQYEISNYAKEGMECQHNLNYWNYQNYLGIGAGAHSRINSEGSVKAIFDTHTPEKWLGQVIQNGHGVQSEKFLTKTEIFEEIIFMGLRLKKGLSVERFKNLTNSKFIETFPDKALKDLEDNGLMIAGEDKIKLTDKGLFLHTAICKFLFKNCVIK